MGTARCRTACESVPHTKAYAPKKNISGYAAHGDVVSAIARWNSTSHSSTARISVASGTRRSSQP